MPASPEQSRSPLGEEPVVFPCADSHLLGVVHHADAIGEVAKTGILIVTGGPQYRIGSHRQFLLLARAFAAAGVPAFRFDHRGSGDSEGDYLGFEGIGEDIAAAIDAFFAQVPGLERVVLWGLCDAASAILFYAGRDPRVAGLLLVNPWVHEEADEDRSMVKHYYGQRILDPVFWRKLLSGGVDLGAALRGLSGSVAGWLRSAASRRAPEEAASGPLPDRMAQGLARFEGPVGLILSGRDLTAREFLDAAGAPEWRRLLAEPRISRHDLPAADHTFSRRVWREAVAEWTLSWLRKVDN